MKTAVSIKSSLLEAFFLLCLFFLAGSESHAGAYEQNRKLGRGVNIIGYDRIWASFDERRFKEAHSLSKRRVSIPFALMCMPSGIWIRIMITP
ncbi:MAG: hypothetical protein ACYTBY_09820 [Planctomycetota bacterium]|jgi:hypothetical protein